MEVVVWLAPLLVALGFASSMAYLQLRPKVGAEEVVLKDATAAQIAVTNAIAALDKLIERHSWSARWTGYFAVCAFVVLVATGMVMNANDTRLASELIGAFSNEVRSVDIAVMQAAAQSASGVAEAYRAGQTALSVPPRDLTEIQKERAGNVSTVLVGAGLFALIFGVLMAIYRQHLAEVSKYQQYKVALMRVRVAMYIPDERVLLQNALVAGAFDYRTGKEKVVESPLPGHPTADALAAALSRLREAVELPKRNP